jgi:hypothetical protein
VIGISVYFVAVLSVITAGFLLAGRVGWLMGAVALLSTDIVLKVIGIISQFVAGAGFGDALLAVIVIVLEAVLIAGFMRYRKQHETAKQTDPTSPDRYVRAN